MPDDSAPPPGKWFRLSGRSRRHINYRAVSPIPGLLLFALLGILGVAALAAAGWHFHTLRHLTREDRILALCGGFVLLVALTQARTLLRR